MCSYILREPNAALFLYLPTSSSVSLAAKKARVSDQYARRLIVHWQKLGLMVRQPTVNYRCQYTVAGKKLAVLMKPLYQFLANEVKYAER